MLCNHTYAAVLCFGAVITAPFSIGVEWLSSLESNVVLPTSQFEQARIYQRVWRLRENSAPDYCTLSLFPLCVGTSLIFHDIQLPFLFHSIFVASYHITYHIIVGMAHTYMPYAFFSAVCFFNLSFLNTDCAFSSLISIRELYGHKI